MGILKLAPDGASFLFFSILFQGKSSRGRVVDQPACPSTGWCYELCGEDLRLSSGIQYLCQYSGLVCSGHEEEDIRGRVYNRWRERDTVHERGWRHMVAYGCYPMDLILNGRRPWEK